jgi:hypothetical protein
VPSLKVKGIFGSGGMPVLIMGAATPLAGSTEKRLLLKSVRYDFPRTSARSKALKLNPVAPITVSSPVAELIFARLPRVGKVVRPQRTSPPDQVA